MAQAASSDSPGGITVYTPLLIALDHRPCHPSSEVKSPSVRCEVTQHGVQEGVRRSEREQEDRELRLKDEVGRMVYNVEDSTVHLVSDSKVVHDVADASLIVTSSPSHNGRSGSHSEVVPKSFIATSVPPPSHALLTNYIPRHTLSTPPSTTYAIVLSLSMISVALLVLLVGTWAIILIVRYKAKAATAEDQMRVQVTKQIEVEKALSQISSSDSGLSVPDLVHSVGSSDSHVTVAASSSDHSTLSVPLSLLDRMHRLPSLYSTRGRLVGGPYVGPLPGLLPTTHPVSRPLPTIPNVNTHPETVTKVRASEARANFDTMAYDDVYATVRAVLDF